MSSSQTAPFSPKESDHPMLEGPDSPPDMSHIFSLPPGSQPARANAETKVNHGAPGSSWSTKKFSDEYDRVLNTLLDSQWDHTMFGDPLLK